MATKFEMSKTYQYRKVMKPLLERKRRARINKCLDDLKYLMADCLQKQTDGDKLEKADILELAVEHLQKLKAQKQQNQLATSINSASIDKSTQQNFRSGYIHAANEVSRALAFLPNVDILLGTQLMTHLGLRLNQLESAEMKRTPINSPLRINCNSSHTNTTTLNTTNSPHQKTTNTQYSPVSSGYASDNDSWPTPLACNRHTQGLLQVNVPVWRPW